MAKANHTSAEENNSPSSLRRLPTKKLSIQAVLEVVLAEGYDPDSARHFVAAGMDKILQAWGVRRRLTAQD
jgi:hypothetical protein